MYAILSEAKMTTSLWGRLRRLFGRRIPSEGIEPIILDWRAEEPPKKSRPAHRRERLDLMKGWVADNPELGPNDVNPEREMRQRTNDRR